MPANTPKGYPYPVGTDRVMDGDNAIQALAEKIDAAQPYAQAAGVVGIPFAAGAPAASVVVTLPAGRFTQTPLTTLGYNAAGGAGTFIVSTASPTATSMTVQAVFRDAGTGAPATTVNVHWHAVQMLAGAAPG